MWCACNPNLNCRKRCVSELQLTFWHCRKHETSAKERCAAAVSHSPAYFSHTAKAQQPRSMVNRCGRGRTYIALVEDSLASRAAVQISRFCIPIAHALNYYNKQSKQYHSLSSLDGTCVPEIHGFGRSFVVTNSRLQKIEKKLFGC